MFDMARGIGQGDPQVGFPHFRRLCRPGGRKEPYRLLQPRVSAGDEERDDRDPGNDRRPPFSRTGAELLPLCRLCLQHVVESFGQCLLRFTGGWLVHITREVADDVSFQAGRSSRQGLARKGPTDLLGKLRISIGFVMYPSNPAWSARSRSPLMACAVKAMTWRSR